MRTIGGLLAVTVALSGCGGGSFDRNNVTAVTRHYFAAIANGNGTETCSLLSESAKQSLGRSVKAVEPYTYKHRTLACSQQVEAARSLTSPQARALRNVALGVPSVTGSRATIRAVSGSRTSNIRLSKTANGWVIDGVVPQTSRPAKNGPVIESQSALERQLAAGQVRDATIEKATRTAHLSLTDGRTVILRYGKGQEPVVIAHLEHANVPFRTQRSGPFLVRGCLGARC